MTMDRRTINILQKIVDDKKESLSLEYLSEEFSVSERTIRNDLVKINNFVKPSEKDKDFLMLGQKGIIKKNEKYSRRDIRKKIDGINFYSYSLSKEERIWLSSMVLTLLEDYITYKEIAEIMYVSRYTIISDFVQVEYFLKGYQLEVESVSNRGIRLIGKEENIRELIGDMLIKNQGLTKILMREGKVLDILELSLEEIDENLEILKKIVNEAENESLIYLTDRSIDKLVYYLMFMIIRINFKNQLNLGVYGSLSKEKLSISILERVSQYFDLFIDLKEVKQLQKFLKKLKYIRKEANNPDILKIQTLTRKFIELISEDLDINLNNDYRFFKNLSNHLERLFTHDDMKYPKFDGIDKILRENKGVLDLVASNKYILEEHCKKSIEEIDMKYIAIYICVAIEKKKNEVDDISIVTVCNSGMSTSEFLKEQIIKFFGFVEVEVVSKQEFREKDLDSVDLVISTVELPDTMEDYIMVSPILTIEDALIIDKRLDDIKLARVRGKNKREASFIIPEEEYLDRSALLSEVLREENVEVDVDAVNWKDAIIKAASILEEDGTIEKRYTEAMIRNIEENGPYVVISKGFALPHGKYDEGVNRLGMSLIRLEKEVYFDQDKQEPVRFVCVLSAVDDKKHLKALFTLVNILRMDGFYSAIEEAKDSENLFRVIKKYEDKYIKLNKWR